MFEFCHQPIASLVDRNGCTEGGVVGILKFAQETTKHCFFGGISNLLLTGGDHCFFFNLQLILVTALTASDSCFAGMTLFVAQLMES